MNTFVDNIVKSSLTLLIYVVLAGVGAFYLLKGKVKPIFFIGFALGALYLLWINAANNKADPTSTLGLNDLGTVGGGVGGSVLGFVKIPDGL